MGQETYFGTIRTMLLSLVPIVPVLLLIELHSAAFRRRKFSSANSDVMTSMNFALRRGKRLRTVLVLQTSFTHRQRDFNDLPAVLMRKE